MNRMSEFHVSTRIQAGAVCPCGQPASASWDPLEGPTLDLCRSCYEQYAKDATDALYAEDFAQDKLLVLANANRFNSDCHDCGSAVARLKGRRAWMVLHSACVTLCDACVNVRMQEMNKQGRYW